MGAARSKTNCDHDCKFYDCYYYSSTTSSSSSTSSSTFNEDLDDDDKSQSQSQSQKLEQQGPFHTLESSELETSSSSSNCKNYNKNYNHCNNNDHIIKSIYFPTLTIFFWEQFLDCESDETKWVTGQCDDSSLRYQHRILGKVWEVLRLPMCPPSPLILSPEEVHTNDTDTDTDTEMDTEANHHHHHHHHQRVRVCFRKALERHCQTPGGREALWCIFIDMYYHNDYNNNDNDNDNDNDDYNNNDQTSYREGDDYREFLYREYFNDDSEEERLFRSPKEKDDKITNDNTNREYMGILLEFFSANYYNPFHNISVDCRDDDDHDERLVSLSSLLDDPKSQRVCLEEVVKVLLGVGARRKQVNDEFAKVLVVYSKNPRVDEALCSIAVDLYDSLLFNNNNSCMYY